MLTPKQLTSFHENGFLLIRDFIPSPLINKLRNFFDEHSIPDIPVEKVIHENKGKKFVTNLENLCRKENHSCLELLGYPPLLAIAQNICGNDFFLIQEFAVIKNLGDELPVLWHQDMVHQRTGQCFTMGIYLDDADENDGALRVVPKSHCMGKPICELNKEPFIEVPAKAGDILIHDMMLAHYSEPLRKNLIRRVLYFEFLSAAHVLNEKIYPAELIERRSRLTDAASRYYQSLHPDEETIGYPINRSADDDESLDLILGEVYSSPVQARPSAYCIQGQNTFSDF